LNVDPARRPPNLVEIAGVHEVVMDVDAVSLRGRLRHQLVGSIAQAPSAASCRGSPAAAETSRREDRNVLFSEAGIVDLLLLKAFAKVSYHGGRNPLHFRPLHPASSSIRVGISPMRIGRKLDINPLHTVQAYFIQLRVCVGIVRVSH